VPQEIAWGASDITCGHSCCFRGWINMNVNLGLKANLTAIRVAVTGVLVAGLACESGAAGHPHSHRISLPGPSATAIPLPGPRPAEIPLPRARPRPVEITPPTETACQMRLASAGAVFTPLGGISGPGECGASDIVALKRIKGADGSPVLVEPPAKVRCEVAEALADFVREDLSSAVSTLGAISRLDNVDSYDCRPRNGIAGARLSEHGHANALDISALRLKNGRIVRPTDDAVPRDVRLAMKTAACSRFATVLGPGSDGFHEDHIHVDQIQRARGHRLCEWDLHDTPRPDTAAVQASAAKIPVPVPLPPVRPVVEASATQLHKKAATNERAEQPRGPRHRNLGASIHKSRRFSRYWSSRY
jgi:hypothetical protein